MMKKYNRETLAIVSAFGVALAEGIADFDTYQRIFARAEQLAFTLNEGAEVEDLTLEDIVREGRVEEGLDRVFSTGSSLEPPCPKCEDAILKLLTELDLLATPAASKTFH